MKRKPTKPNTKGFKHAYKVKGTGLKKYLQPEFKGLACCKLNLSFEL